jgi:hypothetical protein
VTDDDFAADWCPRCQERAADCECDDPDATPLETVTLPCLCGCGVPVRQSIDAEGDDCCATRECVRRVCDRMRAEEEEYERAAREWTANNVGPADDLPL